MTHVILEPCVDVKDTACVDVCPVDCIYACEAHNQYLIHPENCIDCGLCVDACPVEAIFPIDEVPYQWLPYIVRADEYFGTSNGSNLEDLQIAHRRNEEVEARRKVAADKLSTFKPKLPRSYWYLNREYIDSLYSQIQGKLVTEERESKSKEKKSIAAGRISLGSILSALGLGDITGELSAEASEGGALELTSYLTAENKVNILFEYYDANKILGRVSGEINGTALESAMLGEAIYLHGNFSLADFSAKPLATPEERRRFIDSRSLLGEEITELRQNRERGACFVGEFNGRKVIIPFFFSSFSMNSRVGAWRLNAFAEAISAENYFELSIFGTCDHSSRDLMISPMAIWAESLGNSSLEADF